MTTLLLPGAKMVRAALPWRAAGPLLLALLLSVLSLTGRAQASRAFQLVHPRARRVTVPFMVRRNLIIVAARINGQGPYHFMLDTGVSTSLFTNVALADSLHLVRGEELRILGAGGEDTPLRAFRVQGVRTELPGVVAPALSWLLLSDDTFNLSGYAGTRVDGILGADLFNSLVVKIIPTRNELVLADPQAYKPPRGRAWATLPLRILQNKAYVQAHVGQLSAAEAGGEVPLPLELLLDTGAGHALSIETTADSRLHLPPQHLRADLGRGLSGIIQGHLGRVASLALGRYRLPQVLTSFPDSGQVHRRLRGADADRQGNLGFEVLKRFNTIIDYPHQRLFIRPNVLKNTPFEHDMSGLDLLAGGPGYRFCQVLSVVPGSPAAEAGIEPNEELLTVNLLPIELLPLSEITRLLRTKDGQRLLLLLRRPDGELHPVTLYLRRQI